MCPLALLCVYSPVSLNAICNHASSLFLRHARRCVERATAPALDGANDLLLAVMSTPAAPATTAETPVTKIDAPKPERPSSGTRMPSLNQLAARINLNAGSNPASAAARPRLAAALLRTSSQSSLSSTAASTTDSVTVNPPGSRSESPATLSTSPPGSTSSTPAPSDAGSGEKLTSEKLEKLNEETADATTEGTVQSKKQKMPVGYKNIPSLDAITARLAKARTLSVDGTAKPPEAETIEDPKTPGLRIKAPEHPLENKWYAHRSHVTSLVSLQPIQDIIPRHEVERPFHPGLCTSAALTQQCRAGATAECDTLRCT